MPRTTLTLDTHEIDVHRAINQLYVIAVSPMQFGRPAANLLLSLVDSERWPLNLRELMQADLRIRSLALHLLHFSLRSTVSVLEQLDEKHITELTQRWAMDSAA